MYRGPSWTRGGPVLDAVLTQPPPNRTQQGTFAVGDDLYIDGGPDSPRTHPKAYRVISRIRSRALPWDHCRAIGRGLR